MHIYFNIFKINTLKQITRVKTHTLTRFHTDWHFRFFSAPAFQFHLYVTDLASGWHARGGASESYIICMYYISPVEYQRNITMLLSCVLEGPSELEVAIAYILP